MGVREGVLGGVTSLVTEARRSKQVLVIRKDLNMRKGKIAAQAAHAAMKFIIDRLKSSYSTAIFPANPETGTPTKIQRTGSFQWMSETALADWLEESFTKIAVSVNSEAELLEIYEKAKAANLIVSLIQDSGRTEFGGVPTYTAVSVGPAWEDEVDPITGHLPLL